MTLCQRKGLDLVYYVLSSFWNHEIAGPATAGQLQAVALAVRVSYQSAGTVPYCIHTWYSHSRDRPTNAALLLSKWTLEPKNINQTPSYLYNNKQQITLETVPDLLSVSLSSCGRGFFRVPLLHPPSQAPLVVDMAFGDLHFVEWYNRLSPPTY